MVPSDEVGWVSCRGINIDTRKKRSHAQHLGPSYGSDSQTKRGVIMGEKGREKGKNSGTSRGRSCFAFAG